MVGAAAAADRVRGPRPAVVPRSLAAGGRRVSERGDDWDHVTQRDAGPVWKRGEGGEGPGRVRVSARGDMVRHRRVGRAGPGRAAVAQISAGSSLSRLRVHRHPPRHPLPHPHAPPRVSRNEDGMGRGGGREPTRVRGWAGAARRPCSPTLLNAAALTAAAAGGAHSKAPGRGPTRRPAPRSGPPEERAAAAVAEAGRGLVFWA